MAESDRLQRRGFLAAAGAGWTTALARSRMKLQINAKVRAGGEIRIGIHGPNTRTPADCDPIVDDSPARTVTWRGDPNPGVAPGAMVRLRFQLRAAELFGLQWA